MSFNYSSDYNREIREWLLRVFSFAASIQKKSLVFRKCPVCESSKKIAFANNGCFDYVQCQECTLIYMNPAFTQGSVNEGFRGGDNLLTEYFSIIKKYKTTTKEKPDPFTDDKIKDIYSFKPSGKLLDVGCSLGDFLQKAKHFYDVEGVEVNPSTAIIVEKHFKVYKNFLKELGLKKEYDIVTLHQILYGVPDPVGLLQDIYAVLKDGGLLYINTPNANSYAMALFGGKTNHLYGYTTLNVFNKKSLTALAERTGFKPLSFRTEWLDIYLSDIIEYYEHPDLFIHKRNSHLLRYEEKIRQEEALNKLLELDLGMRGNYIITVLQKT